LSDGLVKVGPDLASQVLSGIVGGWGFRGLWPKDHAIPAPAIGFMVGIDLPERGQKLAQGGESVGLGIVVSEVFEVDFLTGEDFQPPDARGKRS
jgi:hypothetical protein